MQQPVQHGGGDGAVVVKDRGPLATGHWSLGATSVASGGRRAGSFTPAQSANLHGEQVRLLADGEPEDAIGEGALHGGVVRQRGGEDGLADAAQAMPARVQ
jgi:hypothetical protein